MTHTAMTSLCHYDNHNILMDRIDPPECLTSHQLPITTTTGTSVELVNLIQSQNN